MKRANVRFGGAFEIVEPVERIGHAVADHHDAMVAHDHHLLFRIGEELCAAFALVFEGKAAILRVDHIAVEEGGAVLVDGRQTRVLQTGQHGCVDRMHMHRAAGMRTMAVQAAVQAPGGRVGCVRPVERVGIVGIHDQQVARLDARKVHLVRVHQEPGAVIIDRKAEMVGNALVHVEPRRPPESGCKINAFLPMLDIGGELRDRHVGLLLLRPEHAFHSLKSSGLCDCQSGRDGTHAYPSAQSK